MNTAEMMEFYQSVSWLGSKPGLERIRELLHRLGNPQNELRYVHVAGTNGKGSVCSMLSSVLTQAGYTTGLYTSPHLQFYNERIKINGTDISDGELCEVARQVKNCVDEMDSKPTEFEILTAMALLYFKQRCCDIVVLEVGLGGRLDATNVVPAPEVAVITNLGLEHTDVLGDTLEKIAEEKGGIIKPGCAAVSYDSAPEAVDVLSELCKERAVPLSRVNYADIHLSERSLSGQQFLWKNRIKLTLPLLGDHQLHNAALALETIETLRGRGWAIPDESILRGLQEVRWPARFEVLGRNPLFILDGGHNPQCVQALTDTVKYLRPKERVVFLIGVLADKDYPKIAELTLPFAKEYICLTPNSDRALPAEELAAFLVSRGARACACKTVYSGIRHAIDAAGETGVVVAFGSLYMAWEVRETFFYIPALKPC